MTGIKRGRDRLGRRFVTVLHWRMVLDERGCPQLPRPLDCPVSTWRAMQSYAAGLANLEQQEELRLAAA